jgi:hypothetical protein
MTNSTVNPLMNKLKKEYTHSGRYSKHLGKAQDAVITTTKTFKRDEEDTDKNKAVFLRPVCDACGVSESTGKDILRAVVKGAEILALPKSVCLALATCYPHSFNRLKEKEAAAAEPKK